MKTFASAAVVSLALAAPALADTATTYPFDGSFDDATFALENAIIERGLVIDWVSHTGDMLARTGEDVGSDVVLFDNADVYQFCSAQLSREVMEADFMNIMHCPYSIFVFERDGAVTMGFRDMPEGDMQVIQNLLDGIVQDAVGN
ncbi:DUF302 domain-containing protein [Loktanella sp. IMCC34160]|uniref:DUF302 domain-containing protein n=1 Tax=Loktanella sp. IMCC34160 TaxID=2510646 RepID=UPI00101CA6CD|nr:DUF302 domain-containing protein [Loktanella sp. IMCC34160]RYG89375.1 DUF302 domain-containing protein [Loktanella sp. IMCC34160]